MDDVEIILDAGPKSYSRRTFIKGVIAAGAAVSASGYLFRGPGLLSARPSAQGSVERLITLSVNGQQRRVDVLPHETLAMTLRYKLGLTGTKLGCDRAECGACTVLVDTRCGAGRSPPSRGSRPRTAAYIRYSRPSWTKAASSVRSAHRAS